MSRVYVQNQVHIFIFVFILVPLLFPLLFSYWNVKASVILNEVAIQPTQAVELYNSDSSISADISSWYIDDSGGSSYFTVPSNTIIPPLSCLVFWSDFNFNKSTSDIVRLINNSNPPTTTSAILIDSYQYSKAPDVGYSFSRNSNNEWETSTSSLGLMNDTHVSCIPTPTPTIEPTPTEIETPTLSQEAPSTPTPSPTPIPSIDYAAIFISEVFPYPNVGGNEWVELYNANDFPVNLVEWYVDDMENNGGTPRRFSLTINPHEYKTIELSSALFNNTGDSVRLLNSEKQEKDSMEYGKVTRGNSIGRISFDEDAYCEQTPTPNNQNAVCLEEREDSSPTHAPISTVQPTKKIVYSPTISKIDGAKSVTYKQFASTNNNEGDVLGEATTQRNSGTSPIPYLSGVSFSYSALTIVSLFIKMRNA